MDKNQLKKNKMKYQKIFIEKRENELLMRNLLMLKNNHDGSLVYSIEKLKKELKEANIVAIDKMPVDVIRLNSTVNFKTSFNVEKTYQLVAAERSDLANNKISILTPMGLALLGYAEGDTIDWEFPIGKGSITILKVEQSIANN